MTVYTFSEARQKLAALLDQARREGAVRIRRRDGQVFTLAPLESSARSPLDVPGVDAALAPGELSRALRQSRRSTGRLVTPPRARPKRRD